MPDDRYSADETRKLAVLIARVWADPKLASDYEREPQAVLRGAGIDLGSRAVPQIPEKPAEVAAQSMVAAASGSSASSLSCATCPCTGCTASCACCAGGVQQEQVDAIMKLAEDPAGREQARRLMANWDVKVGAKS